MAEFVVDNPGGDEAHGVDLIDGDAPPIRMIVHGDLPTSIEREGRTWLATDEVEDAGDGTPPIAVYRPA